MQDYASKESLLFKFLGDICCCKKIDELKTVALEGLKKVIPYESAAFFLVNPQNMQYKEPFFRDLDRAWFYKYVDYYENVDFYKKTVFANGIPFVDRSSDYMDYGDWEKNEHRADFLIPQGIYHLACLQVMDGTDLVGEISLHRGKRQQDFSDEEMKMLLLLHDHVNSAFSRIKLMHQGDVLLELVKNMHLMENPGFILMDKNLNIINSNKSASALISSAGMERIFIEQVRKELKSYLEQKTGNLPPRPDKRNYNHGRYGSLTYQTTIITDSSGQMFFLILVEDTPMPGQAHLDLKKYNMTRRETEITNLILRGKSNHEICTQLFISENTLKTHVKQLYSKLSVKNRSEMLLKLYQQ